MKRFNLSKGTLYFPLKSGETVTNGAVYEIVNGKAQKVANTGATGDLFGVCEGGDAVRTGYVMLDIDPTSVFTESYVGDAPTLGTFVAGCKLVTNVDTDAKTFDYILRKETATETEGE